MSGFKNIRLSDYDYKSDGYYFVTICANYRKPYFIGENQKLITNLINEISLKTKGVKIDYFVIMPEHLHLIVFLESSKINLGSIIRNFKARAQRLFKFKLWQPNYYEHVIRTEKALTRIREYIRDNPEKEKIKFEQFYDIEDEKGNSAP